MRCFVTGGTGFVGGALVRLLIKEGHEVTVLVRPGANTRQLDGLEVKQCSGDLAQVERLAEGMRDCQWVFHLAGLYAYWGYIWQEFLEANVEGTRHVMEAAAQSGIKRIVHTSSIAVFSPPVEGDTCNEESPSRLEDLVGFYKRSKLMGEDVARGFAQQGLPVVIVNPSAPIGVGDWKPTVTGKVIVDFLNGRMPAYVNSRQNMVDVEDVAVGHLLAAQKGRVGERYILGGENLTLKEYLDILADITGLPKVKWRMPYGVAMAWAYIDITLAKIIKGYHPTATPEAVKTGMLHSYFDSSKARHELGYSPGSVREAVRKAVEWYRANGYVRDRSGRTH